ncbi:ATP-binding protein [Maribacter algicola]|uniref:ATP-binding protein n=1 Tax=Meishania litoralis TaxID=3434685 RepID=A0ACC7LGK7_9FLAO
MRCALLILLLFFQVDVRSQIKWSDFDNYTRYTVNDGLPTNTVHNLVEDEDGFLWLGSKKGVSRFDGSTFVNFPNYYENDEPKSIGDVLKLAIDNEGKHIYITSRSGILVSSIKTPKFKPISEYYPNIDFKIGNCRSLYIDLDDHLWAGISGKGLLKINLKSGDNELIHIREIDPNNKPFEEFYQIDAIVPDDVNPEILWLGTTEGLIIYDKSDNSYQIKQYQNNKASFHRYINDVLPLRDKVFVGTNGADWYVLEKSNKATYQIIERDSDFFHFEITKLFKDADGTLWISSYFRGLVQYDPDKKRLIRGVNNNYDKGRVLGITLRDSRGIIWFCDGNGLYKYNPNSSSKSIDLIKNNEFDYPFAMKRIVQIGDHYYICPTDGAELYRISASDLNPTIIPIPPLIEKSGVTVRDIVAMKNDHLLVLGNKSVHFLNTKNNVVTEPPLKTPDIQPIFFRSVAKDKNENFWIATNRDGLYRYNYDSLTFRRYKKEFKGKTSRDYDYFKSLYVDSDNNLWIGQASTSVMNLQNDSIFCLNPDYNYENTLPFGGFYEDKSNRIWVANLFDGISYVDKSNLKSGLNRVLEGSFDGIYRYSDSIVWTVGEGKLGLLNTNMLSHQKINLKPSTHFTGPIVEMENGEYLIGYNNGVLVYDSEKYQSDKELPQTYIYQLKANNDLWYSGADLDQQNFNLPSGTKSLSLTISAMVFQHPEQVSFQYKLDDDIWIDMGNNREINLSNLRQGNYLLDVKAFNAMGNSTTTRSFNFVVQPFWYTSDVAIIFYLLLLTGLVYAFYKFNLNRKLALVERNRIKEIDELKSKMFANISHELRTPLTLIKGFTAMLLKNDKPTQIKNLSKAIESNNDQLLNLVDQMLDLSALDSNKMEIKYKNGDVVKFIKKCVELYKSYSKSKLQHLGFHSKLNELRMDFDDDKLQKILNNLLSNAIKHTPENGRIDLNLSQKDQWLYISVTDTGRGIAQKDLDQVFDRYYKTHDLYGKEGSGIGLALTKELVNLLGGSIQVQSKKGQGSRFTVTLPIKNEAQETPTNHFLPFVEKDSWPETPIEPKNTPVGKPTILLVEDNKDIQHFITALLANKYNIVLANDGSEGIKQAQKKDIDFIISDVMMPHTDGFEFCVRIKSNVATSHIPFLMLSARTDTKDKQKAYSLGVDAYLTKPFAPDELISIINNLLLKQKARQNYLLELLAIKKPQVEQPDINKLDEELVAKLQKIILGNPTKLSANDIAKELLVSRTQLHRKIKSLTGKSLTQYANHIRIEKAKHLLQTTDLQIKEIAYTTGFESPSYFIRLFKKEVGDTPENFKNKVAPN